MPILLGVAMAVIKPGLILPFIFSPLGAISIFLMFALIVLGWMMIRKIIKIDV